MKIIDNQENVIQQKIKMMFLFQILFIDFVEFGYQIKMSGSNEGDIFLENVVYSSFVIFSVVKVIFGIQGCGRNMVM